MPKYPLPFSVSWPGHSTDSTDSPVSPVSRKDPGAAARQAAAVPAPPSPSAAPPPPQAHPPEGTRPVLQKILDLFNRLLASFARSEAIHQGRLDECWRGPQWHLMAHATWSVK